MFMQRKYYEERDSEAKIRDLKQLYLDKQLQIESLERDRKATLRLLNEAQRQSVSANDHKDLEEEANRRKKERILFEARKDTQEIHRFKSESSRKKVNFERMKKNFELIEEETVGCPVDDFKEFIDREYLSLKQELENLRKVSTTAKSNEGSSNNFTSFSNISEISTKYHDPSNASYSFMSNPLKSPQYGTGVFGDQILKKPETAKNFRTIEPRERKPQIFNFDVEKPKLTGILKKQGLEVKSKYPKFVMESNKIEIFPEPSRKSPEILKPKLSEFSTYISVPVRNTARSVSKGLNSERKKKKKEKNKSPVMWENNFYPVPYNYPYVSPMSYNFNPNLASNYFHMDFPERYNTGEFNKAYQPFLYKNDDFGHLDSNENENICKSELVLENKDEVEIEEKVKIASDQKKIEESDIQMKNQNLEHINENEEVLTFGKESPPTSEKDFQPQESDEDDFSNSEIQKKSVLIEIGSANSKTLAQIFQERRKKVAESIQNREEKLLKQSHRPKSRNELIEIRKNMLKCPLQDHHIESPENKSRATRRQRSLELTGRLSSGIRPKISKEEMIQSNKKKYQMLPEVKQKEEEEKKKMEKMCRLQRVKEYERVRFIQNLLMRKKK